MDKPREGAARNRLIRRIVTTVVVVLVVGATTVALSRLKPAAPTVESSTVWRDTVKRGEMLRNVRGLGTLVPEEILFIPAHTRGHIAYVFPEGVFCGDTLFAAGCGRLFEGTPGMMHEALNVKLARLPDPTAVYCGHEYTESNLRFALSLEPNNERLRQRIEWVQERRSKAAADWHDATEEEMTVPSTIGEERATNPFMRVDSAEIVASVARHYPDAPTDPAAILGRVREMKDSF